jgi:hypothetical protein
MRPPLAMWIAAYSFLASGPNHPLHSQWHVRRGSETPAAVRKAFAWPACFRLVRCNSRPRGVAVLALVLSFLHLSFRNGCRCGRVHYRKSDRRHFGITVGNQVQDKFAERKIFRLYSFQHLSTILGRTRTPYRALATAATSMRTRRREPIGRIKGALIKRPPIATFKLRISQISSFISCRRLGRFATGIFASLSCSS